MTNHAQMIRSITTPTDWGKYIHRFIKKSNMRTTLIGTILILSGIFWAEKIFLITGIGLCLLTLKHCIRQAKQLKTPKKTDVLNNPINT